MKKLSKKMLSVLLAFVLVLGIFSVILPTAKISTGVKAETAAKTYDYSVLLADKARGDYVADTRILHNSDGIDHLGIFNSQGLAVRYNGALGVVDSFFSGTPIGAKADEIHPYIIYNVTPGTAFELSSAGYNQASHINTGCNDDERFFNFFVSNDGVNWIPVDAVKNYNGVWGYNASYDEYIYTIDNVGLMTNFVKVEYPMTMASRRAPNYVYVPNESLMVTSVTFTQPETYNANGETLFKPQLFTTQKNLYESYFSVLPEIICKDNVTDPTNIANHYKAATVTYMTNVEWGTYEDEKLRSYVAMVEPGSRFYLETANQDYMSKLGQFMVQNGEISSVDQARIRVYTSATLSDTASDWTEWQPMKYAMYGSGATTPIFNFYLPEDHVYVKIVYPHKGDFRKALFSDGTAVSKEAGNTGCFFNDMIFTPYRKGEANETYDYTVSGTKGYTNTPLVVETTTGIRAKNDDKSVNISNGHPDNTKAGSLFNKGHFSAVYAAEGGKVLSLEYAIRMNTDIYGYGNAAYKANTGEKMGFEISVSQDGVNWSSAYKVLPISVQTPLATIGTSGIRAYSMDYNVPEDAKFVRVDYDLVGNGYIYTNASKTASDYRYFNDAMYIRKVSITDANKADNKVYDYTIDSAATLGKYTKDVLEVSTRTENGGFKGLNPTWGYLKKNTAAIAGTISRAYVTYDIMPGTTFKSDFAMRYRAIDMSEKTAQKNVNEGLTGAKQELVEYEFFIYGKSKNSDNWEYFGKTDSDKIILDGATSSYNTFGFGSFSIDFPDYVDQVKIEFPQTGGFYTDTTNWKDIACGNDGAFLFNMQFVSPDSEEAGVYYGTLNNSTIQNTTKTDLLVYQYGNVSVVNSEGIKANRDNAFVIYKIGENTSLVLRSEDNLSFEYSVDDKNYKAFDVAKICGAYVIPAIADKNYIKVKLSNGQAIAFADCELLPPTINFYVPYLNKTYEIELENYGDTANTLAPTANMLRPGYRFDGWTNTGITDQIYIDTTYEAVYTKTDSVTYTVNWTVDGTTQTKTGVKFDDRVSVTAPKEKNGKVFVKWVNNKGSIVSDNANFSFLASGNLDLTAVYADSKEAIAPYIYATAEPVVTTNDNGTWNMSIVWRTAMPAGVKIEESGIILGTDADSANLVLWDGKVQSGTVKMRHSTAVANKTVMYTVKNIAADGVRAARPYARLSNGSVIYGEIVKARGGAVVPSGFEFNGSISPDVLSNYLDRSLTYHVVDGGLYSAKDVARQTNAKYFARALCHWEPSIYDVNRFETYKNEIAQMHQMDPEFVLEACIFETCGPKMNEIPIPDWVFKAFNQPVVERNFDYEKMLHSDGFGYQRWNENLHVPSISTLEFQMFVYYRACCYIDMGVEAIHFGQMNLIGAVNGNANVVDSASWTKVIDMVNAYAKTNARRGYLIVNGHYPLQNLTRSDNSSKMLVDFNMFPLRITAKTGSTAHTPKEGYQEVMLQTSGDAPYIASRQLNAANKTSPSGYTYDRYPYLLEFDNWGVNEISALNTPSGSWGYDEISWYANQNATDRRAYLTKVSLEVKNLASAPNGHVALVGRRTAFIHKDGCSEYLARQSVQDSINTEYYYDAETGEVISKNNYYQIGVQLGIWDIRDVGDVDAVKAAWEAIGSYGTYYDYDAMGKDDEPINNSTKDKYGIYSYGGIALMNNETSGSTVFRGIHPGWGSLGTAWSDSAAAPYVIYKVKPGSVVNLDLYLAQTDINTNFKGKSFEFTIESSASATSGWSNAVTTASYTANDINILYNVPSNCNYVKITFPQKGSNGSIRGNDYARIMGIKFITG